MSSMKHSLTAMALATAIFTLTSCDNSSREATNAEWAEERSALVEAVRTGAETADRNLLSIWQYDNAWAEGERLRAEEEKTVAAETAARIKADREIIENAAVYALALEIRAGRHLDWEGGTDSEYLAGGRPLFPWELWEQAFHRDQDGRDGGNYLHERPDLLERAKKLAEDLKRLLPYTETEQRGDRHRIVETVGDPGSMLNQFGHEPERVTLSEEEHAAAIAEGKKRLATAKKKKVAGR